MAVVGVRSGVRRRRSSLERCGRSLAAQRLVVGATGMGIGRDVVRSSYNARRRLLGEASSWCFYFLHVDVPSAGSLRPQTQSMQAGYGWCLVLGAWVWYGMFRLRCWGYPITRWIGNWRLRDDRSVCQERIYLAIERRQS
jgi:hypothetical protein